MPLLILRQLPSDSLTLRAYLEGTHPSAQEVLTNLFLAAREVDTHRPDYFYQNRRLKAFGNKPTLREIIERCLAGIANGCLEARGNKFVVKSDVLARWQEVLTFFPPLPLVSYAVFSTHGAPPYESAAIVRYLKEVIDPNAGRTAIPSPFIPQVMSLIEEEGLFETHVHLNGTTEVDHVWLHALENPQAFFSEFRKAFSSVIVQEQFAQIEPGITPKVVFDRLRLAAQLREYLVSWLYIGQRFELCDLRRISNLEALPFSTNKDISPRKSHPLIKIFPDQEERSSLSLEALFHIHSFRYLSLDPPAAFIQGYHLYLLLLGFFNKLLVQQLTQVGFDQFQKITLNETRSASEKTYLRRLQQLSGNSGEDIAFVEGRFAPKPTVHQNLQLLSGIMQGYGKYQGAGKVELFKKSAVDEPKRPHLRLVAHFIKEKDAAGDDAGSMWIKVRHHELRGKLERMGRALLLTVAESALLKKFIVGIDAASNELHAGPEVFAPTYRLFRRNGMNNFTFHVGEDFHHLVSGIRAIYEALLFLDLRQGNRIGHATAVGIDPLLWLRVMEDGVVVTRGEWLDDLVFAYDQLSEAAPGLPIVGRLRKRIEDVAETVYGFVPSISTLINAWRMRELDALACYPERKSTDRLDFGDRVEWHMMRVAKENKGGYELYLQYHLGPARRKMMEYVEADMSLFSGQDLLVLQRCVLDEIHRRQLAIESMPTSNVRISLYDSYRDHHLWRWLGDGYEEKHPAICLGTDDPGIFATNLCNEFSQVYSHLRSIGSREPFGKLRELHENAKRHVFRRGIQ